jgi:hypothetical protein
MTLGALEANHGDPIAALDCATLAIRNYHDSGNVAVIRAPLANLAVLLDRLGRYESAATIAGFSFGPMTAVTLPDLGTAIAHLREVLGDETYESLANGRADDHFGDGDVRIRPNRAGPSRTRTTTVSVRPRNQ